MDQFKKRVISNIANCNDFESLKQTMLALLAEGVEDERAAVTIGGRQPGGGADCELH